MRLALSLDLGYYAVDSEVAANTRAAAAALGAAGAEVEAVELGWSREVNDAWFAYWGVLLAACFGDLLDSRCADLDPHVVALMEAGREMDAVTFKRLEFLRTEQWRKLARVLERFDALLCPTMALPPPPVGGSDSDFETDDAQGRYRGLDMTCPFNFTAQCPTLLVMEGGYAVAEIGLNAVNVLLGFEGV